MKRIWLGSLIALCGCLGPHPFKNVDAQRKNPETMQAQRPVPRKAAVLPPYRPLVSGKVIDEAGAGVPSVTVMAAGTAEGRAIETRTETDPNGGFELPVPPGFQGAVQAIVASSMMQLDPGSAPIGPVRGDVNNLKFKATIRMFWVAGQVCDGEGAGVPDARFMVDGVDHRGRTFLASATTNAEGFYSLLVPFGFTGTGRVELEGYTVEVGGCP